MSEKPFTILVVCTGNIVRSPLAEQLLTATLRGLPELAGQVDILSAGTEAPVGAPMAPQAEALSIREGGDPEGHEARQLTADLIRDSDLVLVATRSHRSAVAKLVPRSARTLFTIREFGRLAEAIMKTEPEAATSADDLRELVAKAAATRGYLSPVEPDDDNIIDPIGRSDRTYGRMAKELVPAVRSASALLFR